jgi:hypothetical protein
MDQTNEPATPTEQPPKRRGRPPKARTVMVADAVDLPPKTPYGETLDILRELLEAIRPRTIAGHKPGRWLACDHPHFRGICRENCPCHRARELLAQLGIEVAA